MCWTLQTEEEEWMLLQIWSAVNLLPEFELSAAVSATVFIKITDGIY